MREVISINGELPPDTDTRLHRIVLQSLVAC